MDVELLQLIGMVAGPTGAAWVGVKVSMNGLKKDVSEIRDDVKDLSELATQNARDVAVLQDRHERPD